MKTLTTIILANTLRGALVEQTPDVDQNHPELVEFKRALIPQITELKGEKANPKIGRIKGLL